MTPPVMIAAPRPARPARKGRSCTQSAAPGGRNLAQPQTLQSHHAYLEAAANQIVPPDSPGDKLATSCRRFQCDRRLTGERLERLRFDEGNLPIGLGLQKSALPGPLTVAFQPSTRLGSNLSNTPKRQPRLRNHIYSNQPSVICWACTSLSAIACRTHVAILFSPTMTMRTGLPIVGG